MTGVQTCALPIFLRNKKRDYKKREVIAILVEWTAMGEKEGGGGGVVQVGCENMNRHLSSGQRARTWPMVVDIR